MSNVTIVSDGTAQGTRVEVDGNFIRGVTKVEIEPIEPLGAVTAKVTVDMVSLRTQLKDAEIVCTDALVEQKIREALLCER